MEEFENTVDLSNAFKDTMPKILGYQENRSIPEMINIIGLGGKTSEINFDVKKSEDFGKMFLPRSKDFMKI